MSLLSLVGFVNTGFSTGSVTLVTSSSSILGGFGNTTLVTGVTGTVTPVGGGEVIITGGGAGGGTPGWLDTITEISGILFIWTCIVTFFVNAYEIIKILREPTLDQVLFDSHGFDTKTGKVQAYLDAHNFVKAFYKRHKNKTQNRDRMKTSLDALINAFGVGTHPDMTVPTSAAASAAGMSGSSQRIAFETLKRNVGSKEVAVLGATHATWSGDKFDRFLRRIYNHAVNATYPSTTSGTSRTNFKDECLKIFGEVFSVSVAEQEDLKKQKCGICPSVQLEITPGKFVCADEMYDVKIQSAAKAYVDANGVNPKEPAVRKKMFENGVLPAWLEGSNSTAPGQQLQGNSTVDDTIDMICGIEWDWIAGERFSYVSTPNHNESDANDVVITFTHDNPNYDSSETEDSMETETKDYTHWYTVDAGADPELRIENLGNQAAMRRDPEVEPLYTNIGAIENSCKDPYYWIKGPGDAVSWKNAPTDFSDFTESTRTEGDPDPMPYKDKTKADWEYGADAPLNFMTEIHDSIVGTEGTPWEDEPGTIKESNMEAYVRAGFVAKTTDSHWPRAKGANQDTKLVKPFSFNSVSVISFGWYGQRSVKPTQVNTKRMKLSQAAGPDWASRIVPAVRRGGGDPINANTDITLKSSNWWSTFANTQAKNFINKLESAGLGDQILDTNCVRGAKRTPHWNNGLGVVWIVLNDSVTNCNKCKLPDQENCATPTSNPTEADFIVGVPYICKVKKSIRSHIEGNWTVTKVSGDQGPGGLGDANDGSDFVLEKGESEWSISRMLWPPCADTSAAGSETIIIEVSNKY